MKSEFQQKLTHWYSVHKRELPWRSTKDPYIIWLSEVILQQTQVTQGMPYFEAFKKHFPTVRDLAGASEQNVLKLWQGLGYYSRARNLHKTARIVCDQYNGKFPRSYEELIKLPGIGDYTASAISSICFDAPHAVVDGNVYRFYSRYFGIDTAINSGPGKKEFKNLAQDLLPEQHRGDFNQAVMEFGSRQCKPKSPDCRNCIYAASCYALSHEMVNALPVKIRNKKIRKRYFNYFLVKSKDQDKVLLNKRDESDIWKNLYELPLIETKESLDAKNGQLSRTLDEILGGISYQAYVFNSEEKIHKLSHQHIHTRFWIVETDDELNNGIGVEKIQEYPVSVLIQDFLEEYGLGA